jgi:FlaA1/EpsC-like NDP-sugar epimerase
MGTDGQSSSRSTFAQRSLYIAAQSNVESLDIEMNRLSSKILPDGTLFQTRPGLFELLNSNIRSTPILDSFTNGPQLRPTIDIDSTPIRVLVRNNRVLVTGAGGSIGSELCRQLATFKPSRLVLLDRCENSLFDLERELVRCGTSGLVGLIGDVTDPKRVNAVMTEHAPRIVFHTAAHKHVPLMEANPCEAVKNNVTGTCVIAKAAESHGVERFILISSDKAVNPASVMGASKRMAELLLQHMGKSSHTRFVTVRFGNVLGSSGSVLPLFVKQIEDGGPITVTHPEMKRFFMLVQEAVLLLLHAAAAAERGSTYVLEMGEPIKILDIARSLAKRAELELGKEIAIEFIGPRPGEKICEELVGTNETLAASGVRNIMIVQAVPQAEPVGFFERLQTLEDLAADENSSGVIQLLQELVSSFKPEKFSKLS